MKNNLKTLLVILACAAVFTLVGCNDANNSLNSTSTPTPTPHTHQFTERITKQPTCTEKGKKLFTCDCGRNYLEELSALGHDIKETAKQEATCTAFGWEAYEECQRVGCDYTTYQEVEIDIENHDYQENVCSRCKERKGSDGLTYALSGGGQYYIVSKVGTCTDTEIIIPNTYKKLPVKEIGVYAFYDCSSVTSVIMGNNVTSIGSSAFYNCKNLTKVEIPNSVTSIGSSAFSSCKNLTKVEIPNSVTSIGSFAFCDCDGMTSITIPDSVKTIGSSAFVYCNSLTIRCESESKKDGWDNSWIQSKSPVVWNCKNNEVANDGRVYTFIEGVRYAFMNGEAILVRQPRNIVKATIKEEITYKNATYGVTSMEDNAFFDCESLKEVEIPNSIKNIGVSAFYNCISLTKIEIPNSVKNIGRDAFYNCTSLTEIKLPDGIMNISYYMFCCCTSLKSITIPDSVTSISTCAFSFCTSLTEIEISKNVTEIGDDAFWGCESLTSIRVDENNSNYKDVDGNLYTKNGKILQQYAIGRTESSFVIPDGVTTIDDFAFANCSALKSITIKNNVTSIGSLTFSNCINLTEIEVPDNVKRIGRIAFMNTGYYNNAENWEDDVLYIGKHLIDAKETIKGAYQIKEGTLCMADSAFFNCTNLTEIKIPNSVVTIGWDSFANCTSLTSVTIGSSIKWIDNSVFNGCTSLTSIKVDENNVNYKDVDGNLYTKKGKSLVQYAIGKTASCFVVPDEVELISGGAFNGCTNLTQIEIPDSVTGIGSEAFENCINLTSAIFETPNGWKFSNTEILGLADAETAATYLKDTYCSQYWKRD